MPLHEVEESELQVLRNSKLLLDRFGADPRTRAKLMELVKIINPNVVIPEVDAKTEVLKEVEVARKELADFKKQVEDEKAEATKQKSKAELDRMIADGRAKLHGDGYTDEGITAIEKLMNERGIANYDAAAALWEKEQPKIEPVTPTDFGKAWNFAKPDEKDEDHKLLLKDPKLFQQRQIQKFMTEQRAGGRR